MRLILSSMMGHVQLRAILDKIVSDHGADEFGDFRWILSGESYLPYPCLAALSHSALVPANKLWRTSTATRSPR